MCSTWQVLAGGIPASANTPEETFASTFFLDESHELSDCYLQPYVASIWDRESVGNARFASPYPWARDQRGENQKKMAIEC